MESIILYATFLSFGGALLADTSINNALQKREDGEFSCYTAGNIVSFSGWCPNINYPIKDSLGRNVMGNLYFALASTTVPDDTVYPARENIICVVNGPTGNITASVEAGIGNSSVNAGASVSFTLTLPNTQGGSICMFTQGTYDYNVTDPITLTQARNLLYIMLTSPASECKTCGRIPSHYSNVTDGTDHGGILKVDWVNSNNCIGKCVGPNSFAVADSAGTRIEPFRLPSGFEANFTSVMVGMVIYALRLA